MANSMTAHSKQLRAKNASEWNKKQIAEGKIKMLSIKLDPQIFDSFDAMAKAQGISRRAAFEQVWAFWQENHPE